MLLTAPFDYEVLSSVRHRMARICADAGLDGRRLDDFVLAVNELMTNAVRYADGIGRLSVWCADKILYCEISDDGPGIPPERVKADKRPSPLALNGRGLWLARQLTDRMTVDTGPAGTTIQLGVAVGG
jgi:anti-sigma regulatory factor (Ser/Thr protein kinase)